MSHDPETSSDPTFAACRIWTSEGDVKSDVTFVNGMSSHIDNEEVGFAIGKAIRKHFGDCDDFTEPIQAAIYALIESASPESIEWMKAQTSDKTAHPADKTMAQIMALCDKWQKEMKK